MNMSDHILFLFLIVLYVIKIGSEFEQFYGDSIDVVRTSRQHISYHFNLMHMNYKNTSVYDNPKDSSNTLLKDSIVILENILLFGGIMLNFIHKYTVSICRTGIHYLSYGHL